MFNNILKTNQYEFFFCIKFIIFCNFSITLKQNIELTILEYIELHFVKYFQI